jgi:hypothetical protein
MPIPPAGTPVKAVPLHYDLKDSDYAPTDPDIDPPAYTNVPRIIKGILLVFTNGWGATVYSIGALDVEPDTIEEIPLEEAAEFARQYPFLEEGEGKIGEEE